MLLLLLIIGLYNKVQWQGRGVVAKLWLLGLRDFSKAPGPISGHLLSLFIFLFIYLFIYLFMHFFLSLFYLFFNVNKFILTTVNNDFL